MSVIRIQPEDFNLQAEVERLRADAPGLGAIVSFLGVVRDIDGGDRIESLFLEHYPGMTERSIEAIVEEAGRRWDLMGSRVIHRVGLLEAADQIVMVAVASSHRQDAFSACQFIMDFLKTRAPIWKKQRTKEGDRWIEWRNSDLEAVAGWDKPAGDGGE